MLLLFGLAVLLRAGAIWWEPNHFWSYTAYYDLASVVANGGGYCMSPDGKLCAYFPPVYPTILAACILTGHARAAIILVGSLIGAGRALLTFLIGWRSSGRWRGCWLRRTRRFIRTMSGTMPLFRRPPPWRWSFQARSCVHPMARVTQKTATECERQDQHIDVSHATGCANATRLPSPRHLMVFSAYAICRFRELREAPGELSRTLSSTAILITSGSDI
jgi:hypothetical protein